MNKLKRYFRKVCNRHFRCIFLASLFLTSLTAILEWRHIFDAFDAAALKLVPDNAFAQNPPGEYELKDCTTDVEPTKVLAGPAKLTAQKKCSGEYTLVLGITQELFDDKFGGHTPINREQFGQLIEDVLRTYSNVKVLAIDYDLSPGVQMGCDSPTQNTLCLIQSIEKNQQEEFDRFLGKNFSQSMDGANGTNSAQNHDVSLVLIRPLRDAEGTDTTNKSLSDLSRGRRVRYGDASLLEHSFSKTVIKHVHVEETHDYDVCNSDIFDIFPSELTRTGKMPLARVVTDTYACQVGNKQKREMAKEEVSRSKVVRVSGEVKLINFAGAREHVYTCPIYEWEYKSKDFHEKCLKQWQREDADRTKFTTIFIGDMYGREDQFRTPIGNQYGVELHAFSSYSQENPLTEHKRMTFFIDLALGLLSGYFFGCLWGRVAHSRENSLRRVGWIFLTLSCLIALLILPIVLIPGMLKINYWMNPLIIMVGLSIHSGLEMLSKIQTTQSADDLQGVETFRFLRSVNGAIDRMEVWFPTVKKLSVLFVVVLGLWVTFIGPI